jgi:N-dimethylarginine dimethylaminohydrolase
MSSFNEYSPLRQLAVRSAAAAFEDDARIERDWRALRFHSPPVLSTAATEHCALIQILETQGAEIISLAAHGALTLDSIYPRDALIVSPQGLILCRMGRISRQSEPAINAAQLEKAGYHIAGSIKAPGTVEGGDFIWLDEHSAAIGLGPRTNSEGIRQLRGLLGNTTELHVVPLPAPDHPEDVFHLMSMISPIDADLAAIYQPLMPESFLSWLQAKGLSFVEVPGHEFQSMGCNILATAPRRVIMLDGLPETHARLTDAGCDVTIFKGDEISRKGDGGPTCLTRPLVRE